MTSTDQEPAITALATAVKAARQEEVVPQPRPRYDSQSKGPVESAGGRAQGLLRIYVYAAEQRYGIQVDPRHPLWLGWRGASAGC